jgi:hypothetical protein
MRGAVALAWFLFARKVGGGIIEVNKEASMQLHFGHVLQQIMPLITFGRGEELTVDLETSVHIAPRTHEIDVLFSGKAGGVAHRIAIELKCYRTLTTLGRNRGATDIFMKDVYEDLARLERYVQHGHAEECIALVMTDLARLVNPKNKDKKCWDYDISNGATFGPVVRRTPIGGKSVHIKLAGTYNLEWSPCGKFWFLEIQDRTHQNAHVSAALA